MRELAELATLRELLAAGKEVARRRRRTRHPAGRKVPHTGHLVHTEELAVGTPVGDGRRRNRIFEVRSAPFRIKFSLPGKHLSPMVLAQEQFVLLDGQKHRHIDVGDWWSACSRWE